MVVIMREADATSVAAAAKKQKVIEQTIYAWRKRFGELAPSAVKRLRTCRLLVAKAAETNVETFMREGGPVNPVLEFRQLPLGG